jgi:CBS domain-containing protein
MSVALRPEDYDHLTRRANDWTLEQAFVTLSKTRPFFCASPTTSVEQALRFMGAGVHHLLVVDPETGAVANLVSQTDMIRELAKHVASMGAAAQLTLSEAGLGQRPVLCVRNTDAALDAFCELQVAGVSGGAIVNGEGKLVGNLSRHDLKGTQGGTGFGALNQSIMHYQRKHRVALAQRLVTVHAGTTLAEVLATMARERVHRVFVVEGGMVPRGLVTQTDVCRVLAERLTGRPFSEKKARKLMSKHTARHLTFPLLFPPKKE